MLPRHLQTLSQLRPLGAVPVGKAERKYRADSQHNEKPQTNQRPPRRCDARGNQLRQKPE